MGIKLQEKQRELRHAISYPEGSDSPADIVSRRNSLAREIKAWRKSQLRALPQLEDVILAADPNPNAEDDILFLPSDIPSDQYANLAITALASTERELREGQANDAISSLCNSILHGMVLHDTKKEHAHGVYQNTPATKYINSVKGRKRAWMARYSEARSRLLRLSNDDPAMLASYPELKEEDTYAKNAASARNLGDGAKVDSWIWTFGRLEGLSHEERDGFTFESKKVQWFRARADMMRWVEEVELLDEEFRRLIRGLEKMSSVWTSLASTPVHSSKYLAVHQSSGTQPTIPGYSAYALRKAAMYRNMANREQERFKAANGKWPGDTETLSEHVLQRRPPLTIDWSQVTRESV